MAAIAITLNDTEVTLLQLLSTLSKSENSLSAISLSLS